MQLFFLISIFTFFKKNIIYFKFVLFLKFGLLYLLLILLFFNYKN